MHIDQAKKKERVFDETMAKALPADDENLQEAARLLYKMIHESTQYAYNALEIEVNGHWTGITSLYHDCVSMVERMAMGGEKTSFLSMAVLEDTFKKVLPLLLVRVESILDGSSKMIEHAKRLQTILDEDPYKAQWKEKADEYKRLVARVGLSADGIDYSDLTRILDPLLDALTFYTKRNQFNPIRRFRMGPSGDPSVMPVFSIHVPVFHSETDLVGAVLSCGKENAVMFAGLELTYGDTENRFEAWYSGYDNERMRNVMRNSNLTQEEYLATVDPYARDIYLCVKSGKELYLMHMPYRRESYGGAEFSDQTKYCYGRRAGYAPYQAFYDEPPAAPEDTTFLAVPRKGYKLSDVMDPEQKAWLPAFLSETFLYFFKNGGVEAVDAYLPAERALIGPDGTELYRNDPPENTLAVIKSDLAMARLQKRVPDPADLFEAPYMKRLVQEFNVTAKDLSDKGDVILSARALEASDLDERLRMAALRILCERARTYMNNVTDAEAQIHSRLRDEHDVIDRIMSGACKGFTTLTVAGVPDEKGVIGRITVDDIRRTHDTHTIWYGPETRSNPPVLYQVRPKTAEDYAAILGLPIEKLKDPLRLYTELQDFWSSYQHVMPRSISYHRLLDPKPLLRQLNLCMSKTSYKKLLEETKKKGGSADG